MSRFPGRQAVIWGLILVAAIFLVSRLLPHQSTSADPAAALPTPVASTPSPQPFQELTIPYLRSRTYTSTLSGLTRVAQNPAYTTYLTTYDSDGLRIYGLLTQPAGEPPPAGGWPGIVFVHGYIPPSQYRTQEKYTAYVDYLARNGFAVFKIDLRGHGASEGEPGGAYYSPDYVIDTLNAYAALQSAPFVNPAHIGLWGHSMAGNILLRSLAAQPGIPATVIWAGAGFTYDDLRQFGIRDSSYRPPSTSSQQQNRRRELFEKYGQFNPESLFWKQVVPTNYLREVTGGIALHHAVDDPVVNVDYSRNLNRILNETPIPHELFEYVSGGHNIAEPGFSAAMERTVAFYSRYLKPGGR